MSLLNKTNQSYLIRGYRLSDEKLFEEVIRVYSNGDFDYHFYKEASFNFPDFIYKLNYLYPSQSELLNYPFPKELEKKISLFSTLLLRELIKDIRNNFRLIKQIYHVIGSQVLIELLDFIEENNISKLRFSDYQLYDMPETALTHLLLYTRPLKEENWLEIKTKMRRFNRETLLFVAIFAYKWRNFFEKILDLNGFSVFLEAFYSLNRVVVNQNLNHPYLNRGEILKIDENSHCDGIIDINKLKFSIGLLGQNVIKEIISIIENQKFRHLDILVIFKAYLGFNSKDVWALFKMGDNVGIRALGTLADDDDTERYLELVTLRESLNKEDFLTFYKKKNSINTALKNLAQRNEFTNWYLFILAMERDIVLERERLSSLLTYEYEGYYLRLVYNRDDLPKIEVYQSDSIIEDHSPFKDLPIYQTFLNEISKYRSQLLRLVSLFEEMIRYNGYLNRELIDLCLEIDLARNILTTILLVNDKSKVGYFDFYSRKLYSPIENEYYDLGTKFKIAHIYDLVKLNQLEHFETEFIKNSRCQYLPQLFRETYAIKDIIDFKEACCIFTKCKSEAKIWLRSLLIKGWEILSDNYIYRDLQSGQYRILIPFSYIDVNNEILEIDSIYFIDHNKKRVNPQTIEPILLSEVIREVDIAVTKSIGAYILPNQINIKKRFTEKWIDIFNIKNVELSDDFVIIKGNLAVYRIDLNDEKIYISNEYGELKELIFLWGIKRNNESLNLPFHSLLYKVNEILADHQFTQKTRGNIEFLAHSG